MLTRQIYRVFSQSCTSCFIPAGRRRFSVGILCNLFTLVVAFSPQYALNHSRHLRHCCDLIVTKSQLFKRRNDFACKIRTLQRHYYSKSRYDGLTVRPLSRLNITARSNVLGSKQYLHLLQFLLPIQDDREIHQIQQYMNKNNLAVVDFCLILC